MQCAMLASFFLALLTPFLLILSFPNFNFGFLAWIAFIPLIIAIYNKGLRFGFMAGLVTGIIFFMGIFYWVLEVAKYNILDFFLCGLYLSLYFALFGLFLSLFLKTRLPLIIIAPITWVPLEYIRSHFFFLSLPWALLGHSQHQNLPLIQIAAFTGVYGISFLIMLVNATLTELIIRLRKGNYGLISLKPMLGILLIVVLAHLYGFRVMSHNIAGEKIKVSLIQPNIEQKIKWDPEFFNMIKRRYIALTKEASLDKPSLIAWPETSIPGHIFRGGRWLPKLARAVNAYLLVGTGVPSKFGRAGVNRERVKKRPARGRFNSAFLISPGGRILGRYDKVRLVPFGEYLPLKDHFPWPSWLVAASGNDIPGSDYKVFKAGKARFGVLICWENIFPEVSREFVKRGADFLINMTNEAWFGKTAAPHQMLTISVFRAVENRLYFLRAANTGVSCVIDPYGRIVDRVEDRSGEDIFVTGTLTQEIIAKGDNTFYTSHGDVFVYLCIGGFVCLVIFAFVKRLASPTARH